jgi:hypothetical protein
MKKYLIHKKPPFQKNNVNLQAENIFRKRRTEYKSVSYMIK